MVWVSVIAWVVLSPFGAHLTTLAEAAQIERLDGLRVVRLSGSPYELGYQHGEALREEVRECVRQVLGYFRGYLKVPGIRSWAANWWLDSAWKRSKPFISRDYLEELRGLSDGSGVPLQELHRLHAIPERTYSCSSFAAWGRATSKGQLIHMRNLDWSVRAGIQRFPVVFIVHPAGKRAFLSAGWAGFVGVLTGVNDQQLSIAQIGAKTRKVTFRGEPMVFLMRRVLEEAGDLEAASSLIFQARRTIGANYLLAQANAHYAIVMETTCRYARVFHADDPLEHGVSYARPIADVVFRADVAMDPIIRNQQLASRGDPKQPGLEDPAGSSAYDVRYLAQAAGILAHYGTIDAATAQAIAKAVAPPSNIQSVVFDWPWVWVANADGAIPAAQTTYRRINAERLLQ
jgi:hypothetical protein